MSSTLLFQGRNANWDFTHFAEIFCYLVIFAFIDIKWNSTLKDIVKAALLCMGVFHFHHITDFEKPLQFRVIQDVSLVLIEV